MTVENKVGTIDKQTAYAIGVTAYIYFYPLVTMDVTRKQLTNVAKPEGMNAPMKPSPALPRSRRRT